MTINGYLQLALYMVVLIALAKPLGWYMARVYDGQSVGLNRVLGPLERGLYRLCGTRADEVNASMSAVGQQPKVLVRPDWYFYVPDNCPCQGGWNKEGGGSHDR